MLRIELVALEVVRGLAPVFERVGRRDRGLADQLRRAMSSVVLNLAEGSHSRGRNKPARYQTALASGKEVRSALLVAEAYGYCEVDAASWDRLDQVLATTYRLVHPR